MGRISNLALNTIPVDTKQQFYETIMHAQPNGKQTIQCTDANDWSLTFKEMKFCGVEIRGEGALLGPYKKKAAAL